MARFRGSIGYAATTETAPDVWTEEITERNYYVDIIRNSRRLESSGTLNDNINISNEFSIVADPFAKQNFHAMRYIKYMGTKWKITTVTPEYPRLRLSVGGVWNGE